MNGSKSASAYASLKYQLNAEAQLYADALIGTTKTTYVAAGITFWSNAVDAPPLFYDLDSGHFVDLIQHLFAPEEVGHEADQRFYENSYSVNLGVRGTLGSSNWNYGASFHRSEYDASQRERRLLTARADAFFLFNRCSCRSRRRLPVLGCGDRSSSEQAGHPHSNRLPAPSPARRCR